MLYLFSIFVQVLEMGEHASIQERATNCLACNEEVVKAALD